MVKLSFISQFDFDQKSGMRLTHRMLGARAAERVGRLAGGLAAGLAWQVACHSSSQQASNSKAGLGCGEHISLAIPAENHEQ